MNDKRNLGRRWRISLLIISALLQGTAMVLAFLISRRYITNYILICEFVSLCTTIYIIREDVNSSYKLPWVALTAFMPILSGPIYLLFGRAIFTRSERKRMSHALFEYLDEMSAVTKASTELKNIDEHESVLSDYIRNASGSPVFKGTDVKYYSNGRSMFEDMLKDISKAETSVYIEYFIIKRGSMWSKLHTLLLEKVKAGVDVRVMYDDIGSIDIAGDFIKELKSEGIKVTNFNPFRHMIVTRLNNRDHRKFCIVDGKTAYTGGINIGDEYIGLDSKFGYWKDSGVRIEGEAAWSMESQFLLLWNFATGETTEHAKAPISSLNGTKGFVQPFYDSPLDDERVGETVYSTMVRRASRYCYISTPYLVIDDVMISSLVAAAKSGVDVRLLTPGHPDKKLTNMLTRSYYDVLLRAGVRIFEQNDCFVHAKNIVCDDKTAVVATINLDYRSFRHHFENGVWLYKTGKELDVKADFIDAFEKSSEYTLEMSRKKSILHRLILTVLRILAPMF